MTGDRNFKFVFTATDKNPAEKANKQFSLFSTAHSELSSAENTDIMLFSGGLDSLAGVVQRLNEYPERSLCVVSHKSNKSVTHTQDALLGNINERYGNRVKKYLTLQTLALEHGGTIPNEELLKHLDRATEINKRIPLAHDAEYQRLFNMKRDVFERIYAEIEAEANQKLQFRK